MTRKPTKVVLERPKPGIYRIQWWAGNAAHDDELHTKKTEAFKRAKESAKELGIRLVLQPEVL